MMLITSAVVFLALFGAVEPFKISLKQPVSQPEMVALPQAPPAIAQPSYYQQQKQTTLVESEPAAGVKGAALAPAVIEQRPVATLARQPLAVAQPAPIYAMPPSQTLAYVFIRPLQPKYQYLSPMRYSKFYTVPPAPLLAPLQQGSYQQEPIRQQTYATKGEQQIIEQHPTKSAAQPEAVEQETIQEIYQEQQPAAQFAPVAPALLAPVAVARGPSKFARLRSSFDRFAASAKSKLTLGSSYQVVGEEIVQPPPPPQPLEQQKQTQTQDIALTQQEQESIRETEQQEQHFEPQQQHQQLEGSKGQQQQQVLQQVVEQKEQAKGLTLQQQQPQQQQQEEALKESVEGFRREQTRVGSQQFAQQKSVQVDTRYNSSKNY